METRHDRHGRGRSMIRCVALSLLAWSLFPAPAGAQDAAAEDPPRQDVRMGNTDNMRLGRDAQGGVVMEVRPPKKDPATQPPVGPFFIYPQVGTPPGPPRDSSGQSSQTPQATGSGTPSGSTGQTPPPQPGPAGKPGQPGQVGNTVIYHPGQSGQVGNTVIYNPGLGGPPPGPGKGSGS